MPSTLEPHLWVGGPSRRSAVVSAGSFARIAAPYRAEGDIEVRLEFATDAQGRRILDGSVSGEVSALCQACLREFRIPVSARFGMTLVATETEGRELPPERDYLVDAGRPIALPDLVEDEFLLALPMIPVHGAGQCATEPRGEDGRPRTQRPFAGLGSLMSEQRKPR